MKKGILLLVLATMTITLTGCMGYYNYPCSEDDYLLMSFGNTHPNEVYYHGMNTGILNQCNHEENNFEELEQIRASLRDKRDVKEYEGTTFFDQSNYEEDKMDEVGYLTRGDMGSVDFFSLIEGFEPYNNNYNIAGLLIDIGDEDSFVKEEETVTRTYTTNDQLYVRDETMYFNDYYTYFTSSFKRYDNLEESEDNLLEMGDYFFRFIYEDGRLMWDSFSHNITQGDNEQFIYKVYEENNKFISLDLRYHNGEVSSGPLLAYYEVDFKEKTSTYIEYNNMYNYKSFRIIIVSQEEQMYVNYYSYIDSDNDLYTTISYGFLKDNEFVMEVSMPNEDIPSNDCSPGDPCYGRYTILYNMKFVEGWNTFDGGLPDFDTSTFHNNNGYEYFSEYELELYPGGLIYGGMETYYNVLRINSHNLFTQERLNNPQPGLGFEGYNIDDVYDIINDKKVSIEEDFTLTEKGIVYYGETLEDNEINDYLISLFPRMIKEYLEEKSIHFKN